MEFCQSGNVGTLLISVALLAILSDNLEIIEQYKITEMVITIR